VETVAMGSEPRVEGAGVEREPQNRLASVPMTTGPPKRTVRLAKLCEDLYRVRIQNPQPLFV
jgi:hypothetical protein